MADRFPLIANTSANQIQELASGDTLNLTGNNITGAGIITATTGSFTGNVSIGGTLTYEDVTNVDSVGIITAQAGIEVTGIITARSGTAVTFTGGLDVKDASETVSVGSTSAFTSSLVTLECDCKNGTVFTHDLEDGSVGVVSVTNFPVTKNSFHTVTIIFSQNSTGTGNTTAATGIGTNITLTPSGVSGFTTAALVGSGTTVTLSTTAEDIDIVTFGIHYNGSGTGTPANYKTFATKNGDFRLG